MKLFSISHNSIFSDFIYLFVLLATCPLFYCIGYFLLFLLPGFGSSASSPKRCLPGQEPGLPNAKKKDSTGICFIGERPFREFLNRYIAKEPGPIKNAQGRVLGTHQGLSFYTLGQRQGLGIGGVKEKGQQRGGGEHTPWFVARKDVASNTLWVVQGHDHPWLLSQTLSAQDASWVSGSAPSAGSLASKTRYRQLDSPCTLDAETSELFRLSFADPQWAVTPGQSAVLYDGELCLGGGVISG